MYDKIYDIVIDKFFENRDDFWLKVNEFAKQEYEHFKDVEKDLEKLLKKTKELEELEDIMNFLHSKIYR